MNCDRCKITIQNNEKLSSFVRIDGVSFSLRRCPSCSKCIGFQVPEGWCSIDQILKRDLQISGLHPAISTEDKVIHYILRQFLHNEDEYLKDDTRAIFDEPDKHDVVVLLWINGSAIGFYTLKSKGTWIEETDEAYNMTTLDTIFIRKCHRRNGYCQEMLRHICASNNDEDIGVSKPISPEMKAALQKFLTDQPHMRSRLWEINGTGGEGHQKLVWYVLAKEEKCRRTMYSGSEK
ncbi:hypothetical protein R5R35_002823 [Gryllus longicercus]|uniref:N-acetyltransferase domain-containing protein n=1 Tax=Gryllus longicercus TaxID=2509291 RepID=A0AAN9ZAF9_9ORTH